MNQLNSDVIVNAGCLLFFHQQRHTQDVMDSTLYVQLAASKKYSKFADYTQWSQTWLAAAQSFGWIVQARESFDQPVPCQEPASFWEWARILRPGFVSEALLERSEAMLARCPVLQPAFDVLAEQALGPGATTLALQIGLVDADGSLTLIQIHFESRRPLGRKELFGRWSGDTVNGNITLSFHRLSFAESLYAPVRDAFAKALQNHRGGLVCPVISEALHS